MPCFFTYKYILLYFADLQHAKIYSDKISFSGTYTFLEFRKFQPQHSYKKKKENFFLRFTARCFSSLLGVLSAQCY